MLGGCGCAAVLGLSILLYVHGADTGRLQGQVGAAPRLGALGHQESSPSPALQQGGQPSQRSQSLLRGKAGWREGVGRGTDVPVNKSLTPSREPSAYMKDDQPLCPGWGWYPPRGPPKPM